MGKKFMNRFRNSTTPIFLLYLAKLKAGSVRAQLPESDGRFASGTRFQMILKKVALERDQNIWPAIPSKVLGDVGTWRISASLFSRRPTASKRALNEEPSWLFGKQRTCTLFALIRTATIAI